MCIFIYLDDYTSNDEEIRPDFLSVIPVKEWRIAEVEHWIASIIDPSLAHLIAVR